MALDFLFKGVAVGFLIAAPVGPIGVLCIRRSLADGTRMGFAAGLGAATADAAYGGVAGIGLTAVSSFLVRQRLWLGALGGLCLCCLGIRALFSRPPEQPAVADANGLLAIYSSTFLLTLANPATILSFAAVFAGFGLGAVPDYRAASALVGGVFAGSALWWLALSGGIGLVRGRMTPNGLRSVNRLTGVVLFAFGICVLARLGWR